MTYSVDLRKKVAALVRAGGGQREAARHFDISLWCVWDWLARQDLQPRQTGVSRQRRLDQEAVRAHVRDHPDALWRERVVLSWISSLTAEAAAAVISVVRSPTCC